MLTHKYVMTNITLSLPDELLKRMKKFDEIKWSAIVRKIIEQKVKDFEMLEKITSKSRLTDKDAEEIGKKIKRDASLKFYENSVRH